MHILVIRHGQTELNKTGRTNGQTIDDHLSAEGKEQVEKLSLTLPRDLDTMYVSDLSRTRETAEIINKVIKIPVIYTPDLREVDLGGLTGKTWEEMNEEYKEDISSEYMNQKYDFHRFGGESAEDVKERVFRLLNKIKEDNGNKNILLVTHAGVIRILQYVLENRLREKIDNEKVHSFEI